MIRYYLIIIFICYGCYNSSFNNEKVKPDNLITKNKMVDILYDMSLISVAKGVNRSILENNGIIPENYIFSKYEIDSLTFANSNEYYSYDLKEYQLIYDLVKIKLQTNKKITSDSIEIVKKISGELSKKLINESKQKKIKIDTIKFDSITKINMINKN